MLARRLLVGLAGVDVFVVDAACAAVDARAAVTSRRSAARRNTTDEIEDVGIGDVAPSAARGEHSTRSRRVGVWVFVAGVCIL